MSADAFSDLITSGESIPLFHPFPQDVWGEWVQILWRKGKLTQNAAKT